MAQSGSLTKILVIPDVHVPFHSRPALNCTLRAIELWEPDHIVSIGDFLDCFSVSFHSKDPTRKLNLKQEVAAGNKVLDRIEAVANGAQVHFIEGNHEYRLTRYLQDKAPELFGLVDLQDLLHIEERGWTWTPYRKSLKLGKLHFTHDVGRCGKTAAAASLADYGHSLVIGHSHRAAIVYDGTIGGERRVAMNVGTLLDVNSVDYKHQGMAKKEWQVGFGTVHMTPDGIGFCQFHPIIKGRTVVDGIVIDGKAAR